METRVSEQHSITPTLLLKAAQHNRQHGTAADKGHVRGAVAPGPNIHHRGVLPTAGSPKYRTSVFNPDIAGLRTGLAQPTAALEPLAAAVAQASSVVGPSTAQAASAAALTAATAQTGGIADGTCLQTTNDTDACIASPNSRFSLCLQTGKGKSCNVPPMATLGGLWDSDSSCLQPSRTAAAQLDS